VVVRRQRIKQAKGLVSGECYQLLITIGIHVSKMADDCVGVEGSKLEEKHFEGVVEVVDPWDFGPPVLGR